MRAADNRKAAPPYPESLPRPGPPVADLTDVRAENYRKWKSARISEEAS